MLVVLPLAVLATAVSLVQEATHAEPDAGRLIGLILFVLVFPPLFVWLSRVPESLTTVTWLMWSLGAVYTVYYVADVLFRVPVPDLPLRLAEILPWLWAPYLFAFALLPIRSDLYSGVSYALSLLVVVVAWLTVGVPTPLPEGLAATLLTHTTISPALAMSILFFVRQVRVEHQTEAERAASLVDLAHSDALTGLPNRRAALACYATSRFQDKPAAIVLFDLDHFKDINDLHGHEVGDAVLRTVAETTQETVRPDDFVARWGGEEFLLLLPACPLDGARAIAERVRKALERVESSPNGPVTASFGVITCHPDEPLEQALERADQALYDAKAGGRNQVRCA